MPESDTRISEDIARMNRVVASLIQLSDEVTDFILRYAALSDEIEKLHTEIGRNK
jgi:hypothetical protein